MTKTNSLKLVPFTTRARRVDGLPYEEWPQVPVMMEYTSGKAGDQKTTGWGSSGSLIDWRPNLPFTDTLIIDRLERGRSAARFWFIGGEDGTEYPFFGQGLTDMLQKVTMVNGAVHGDFIAVKRGANYGVELYD